MPTRILNVAGRTWRVFPSGRVTQYDRDEFALLFVSERSDGEREVRVTRYSPTGARARERSLAEMTDGELERLFGYSQPSETSPEAGYAK
jgi:hypothetical protein